MSKTTIKPNELNGKPVIYFDQKGEVRPIAWYDENRSYQVVTDRDIAVTRGDKTYICHTSLYHLGHDKYVSLPFGHPFLNKITLGLTETMWLMGDNFNIASMVPYRKLKTVLNTLTHLNVDTFLEEIAFDANYDMHKWNLDCSPKLVNVDLTSVDYSMSRFYKDLPLEQGDIKLRKIFSQMPKEYSDYIADINYIADGFYLSDQEECDWRRAMDIPKITSVCCLWEDDTPVRYNDIILINEDDSVELYSMYTFLNSIEMIEHNFACFPFEIPNTVKRMIHVTHGVKTKGKSKDMIARWQLFRKK